MTQSLHHASITTPDVARLSRFYCEFFGFERVLETQWNRNNPLADTIFGLNQTAVQMVMLRSSNAFLELFEFANPIGVAADPGRTVCDQGITHICISVDDVDREYQRLLAAGVPFNSPPVTAEGLCRATYARDPDGNIIELMTPDPAGPFALPTA